MPRATRKKSRTNRSASFRVPVGIVMDSQGSFYIADTGNKRIRKLDLQTKMVTTIAGNGEQSFVMVTHSRPNLADQPALWSLPKATSGRSHPPQCELAHALNSFVYCAICYLFFNDKLNIFNHVNVPKISLLFYIHSNVLQCINRYKRKKYRNTFDVLLIAF